MITMSRLLWRSKVSRSKNAQNIDSSTFGTYLKWCLKNKGSKKYDVGISLSHVLDDKRLFLSLHYKENCLASCDLKAFLKDNGIRDVFDLGYFFHLYCDNKIEQYDLKDINQYDALIFDMQKVSPHSNLFKTRAQDERESLALKNIQALDKEPMPLYIPNLLKKRTMKRYCIK